MASGGSRIGGGNSVSSSYADSAKSSKFCLNTIFVLINSIICINIELRISLLSLNTVIIKFKIHKIKILECHYYQFPIFRTLLVLMHKNCNLLVVTALFFYHVTIY